MQGAIEIILMLIIFGWLIVLTFFVQKMKRHYSLLTNGVDGKNLTEILESVIGDSKKTEKQISEILARCAKIEQENLLHIQKIGLLRFNPFKDTGGDQSFILSLIDAENSGIVISGLYSRSGTRWYAKRVVKGKGQEHDLSDDEKKAIRMAK